MTVILSQGGNGPRMDPRSLTNVRDILKCLSELQAEETEVSETLTEQIAARRPIEASLERLHGLVPELNGIYDEATELSKKVSLTAKTAQRVGGRVRSLDEEMRRIRDAGDRVSQVMELKSSLLDLQASIDAKDWESAARHCARAMSLPIDVISGPFAETAVPTEESHLPPAQTLETAREHLLTVFRQNFEQASRSRDSTSTSRYFKLFPAIGWEAEGLQAYADFVTDLVRVRSPSTAKTSSPLYYITALTALFESIAMIVDQHQPVVEKYYGVGKMKSVVDRLLQECDRLVKGLIEGWEEDRSMRRKLSDVAAHPPASMFTTSGLRNRQPSVPDEDIVDPREIDKVISEAGGMAGRWNLFRKFLSESFREDSSEGETGSETEAAGTNKSDPVTDQFHSMGTTSSHGLIEQMLTNYYIPLETWYIRTIIDKAHRMSNSDVTQSPPTTTTPDDVFYVLKLVLIRLLSTGSLRTVEKTLDQLRELMERDYAGIIKRKLDDVYRTAGTSGASGRGEKIERENRVSFIILLNDLDISMSHLDRLVRDLSSSSTIGQHFIDLEQTSVRVALSTFSNVGTKLKNILRIGVEQLFNQLMRPKLRNLIPEVYKDVSYVLDDDAYASAEYQDVVRKRFIKSWENLAEIYRDTFTEGNHRQFFGLALDVFLRPWEKHLMSLKYSELGAIRFDRDLRAIISYLTAQTAFGDTREKFVRMQQISTLLNLDAEEDVDEFYNSSGITWKLTAQEARSIAGLKV